MKKSTLPKHKEDGPLCKKERMREAEYKNEWVWCMDDVFCQKGSWYDEFVHMYAWGKKADANQKLTGCDVLCVLAVIILKWPIMSCGIDSGVEDNSHCCPNFASMGLWIRILDNPHYKETTRKNSAYAKNMFLNNALLQNTFKVDKFIIDMCTCTCSCLE